MPILPHLDSDSTVEGAEGGSTSSQSTVISRQGQASEHLRSQDHHDFGRSPVMTRHLSQQVARQLTEPTQGSSESQRSQPVLGTRQESPRHRQVDRKRSRAAYLGAFRKSCRGIFEVLEEPNNGEAVYELKEEISRKWLLYVSAHRDFLEFEDLDEERQELYAGQHKGYQDDYEDTLKTLEAYLKREARAEQRAREVIARRQAESGRVAQEKAKLDREIRELRRSVEKMQREEQDIVFGRRPATDSDLFGIRARQRAREKASGQERHSVRDELRSRWKELTGNDGASPENTELKTRLGEAQRESSRQETEFDSAQRTSPRRRAEDRDQRASTPRRRTSDASSLGYSLDTSPLGGATQRQAQMTPPPRAETVQSSASRKQKSPAVSSHTKRYQLTSGTTITATVPAPDEQTGNNVDAQPFVPTKNKAPSSQFQAPPGLQRHQACLPPVTTQVPAPPGFKQQDYLPYGGNGLHTDYKEQVPASQSAFNQGSSVWPQGQQAQPAGYGPTGLWYPPQSQDQGMSQAQLGGTQTTYASQLPLASGYQAPTTQPQTMRPPDYLLPQLPQAPAQNHIPFAGAPAAQQSTTTDMLAQALLFSNLPRPDMLQFDGDVKSWASFYHNFQSQIGGRVQDPAVKLNYLIQFCTGTARKVIEQCVLLPPQVGYDRAIKQLSDRFGSKHMVAASYIAEIKQGPKVQPNNVEALLEFADSLDTAYVVLSQLDYTSDVNSTDTIGSCVRRLPQYIANKWVDQAAKITLEQYREPQFLDFVNFVKAQASVANTYYGREAAKANQTQWKSQGQQNRKPQANQDHKPRQTTMAAQQDSKPAPQPQAQQSAPRQDKKENKPAAKVQTTQQASNQQDKSTGGGPKPRKACPLCDLDSHKLQVCRKFKALPMADRVEIVMKNGLCFRCLTYGHLAKECDKVCAECGRRHHAQMHDPSRERQPQNQDQTQDSKTIVNPVAIVNKTTKKDTHGGVKRFEEDLEPIDDAPVWLCIVPVIVHGAHDREIKTYAFIDSGSNTTLMTRGLFEQLGVEGLPIDYNIRSLGGNHNQGDQYEGIVKVSAIDKSETVTVRISTVFWLPIPLNSPRGDMDRWKHLEGIEVASVGQAEVGLLIGMDCPEMQWSFEEIHGGRGEPFARKTLFGWTIMGPTVPRLKQLWGPDTPITQASSLYITDPLRQQLERQWNADMDNGSKAKDATEKQVLFVHRDVSTIGQVAALYEPATGVGESGDVITVFTDQRKIRDNGNTDHGNSDQRTSEQRKFKGHSDTGGVYTAATDRLEQLLRQQWTADFQDLHRAEREAMSVEDKRALQIMQDSVKMVNGKYQIAVPWKDNPEELPNDRVMAEKRLKGIKRKLEGNETLREQYTTTVEKYVSDGHARQVGPEELTENQGQWYLPHHPVFKRSNPEKCRVVFDCAAKFGGTSLNDAILQGPNMMNNLAGVLIRFRREQVAVVADIQAMFHQCQVTTEDQRYFRFLWWPGGDLKQASAVFCMTVHLFGATSSPSVAGFCMKKTADDNETDFTDTAIDTLRRAFYVDDMLRSVATVDEACALVKEMKELLGRGGFNLTKFLSSERDVVKVVPEEDKAKQWQKDLGDSALPTESALGLKWDVETDSFIYETQLADPEPRTLTKRTLLSKTASLYDPLGFVGPVLLVPRLIQQELCKRQLDWDDEVPQDLLSNALKWIDSVTELGDLKIKRCIKPPGTTDQGHFELHTFCDASEVGYGAVVYARYEAQGQVKVSFLFGKSRVAPLQLVSVPRLELTAAVLACRCYKFIMEELDLTPKECYFWTDSQTVLKYLENTSSRYKTFVAHRIAEIHAATKPSQWCYVPTSQNPADLASRGVWPQEQDKLKFWIQGPSFLQSDDKDYRNMFSCPEPVKLELEVKAANAERVNLTDQLIHRYSDYHRLCKAVAWIRKFYVFKFTDKQPCKAMLIKDIKDAETVILLYIQGKAFKDAKKSLLKGQDISPNDAIASLDPFLDDNGLIRVGGRLANCDAVDETHPIVLPVHHVTDLIIRGLHETNAHAGPNYVLSMLRRKFYLVAAYRQVKKVLQRCVECRKLFGKVESQKMSSLPKARVAVGEPPFTFVGVDYFGPFHVKFRRGTTKRWGCLFTCLTTRAVHLETVHEMSADSFIMAFHRFIGRRGTPKEMFSDNGSNFVAADKELADEIQAINSLKTDNEMLRIGVKWNFIPPRAPHMGGAWERLVKSVKETLKGLITRRLLDDEELRTYLTEAEKILNDRPLTRMGSHVKDPVPLTPSDLLLLKRNSADTAIADDNPLRKRWTIVQDLANKFFERFTDEYLPALQERSKWIRKRRNIQANDVVLVVTEEVKRGQWPLGLVIEPIVSDDGLVRSAIVKVGNKEFKRPVNKLIFLESGDEEIDVDNPNAEEDRPPSDTDAE